jgi:dihydrofolate synthase/folylpolyglutamate synthase
MTEEYTKNKLLNYRESQFEDCPEQKNEEQRYAETIQLLKNLTKFGINLGLERIKSLLERLGNPQNDLKIIHIGGTNGKGSTVALLQAILKQAGYRVGMFVSPHLHDYRERISINGELISPGEVIAGFGKIQPVLKAMVAEGVEHPTEFEVTTALALLYFSQKKPDFVLLEVGLGGEIDSTNVATPLISVLTNIGMDHLDYLGNTLEEITTVKAGIIKEGIPVVTSADKPAALKVIEEQAQKKKAKLFKVGQDIRWQRTAEKLNSFSYQGLKENYYDLKLALDGEHQFTNATTALAVCEVLKEQYAVSVPEKAMREGLKNVSWPGRLELVSLEPKILLDGAHNVDGMKALAKALVDYENDLYRRERLVLCLGMLKDKEIEKALGIILPLAAEVIVTKPDSPRAGDWEYVAQLAKKHLGGDRVHTVEDPTLAIQEGLKRLNIKDMLCVTGSLYMIAPIRKYLLEQLAFS